MAAMRRFVIAVPVSALLCSGCLFVPVFPSGDPTSEGGHTVAPASQEKVNSEITPEAIAVMQSLNEYWDAQAENLGPGFDFEPLPLSRVSIGNDGVKCNGEEVLRKDLRQNAYAASCYEGYLVAYDRTYTAKSQARLEAALSHEWGHLVQFQGGDGIDLSKGSDGLPIFSELQADCLSGAWAAQHASSDVLNQLDDVADAGDPDSDPLAPDAHGTSRQRQQAYLIGYTGTPNDCIDTIEDRVDL